MKNVLLLGGVLLLASTTGAIAAGPYVGASGGVNIVHDGDVKVTGVGKVTASYDTGYGFNVAAGYDFDGARVEGEFGYKKAGIDKLSGPGGSVNVTDTDIRVMSYMINCYYDVKTNTNLSPFIGAGLGIVNGEIQVQGSKEDETEFGYQLTAGASYDVNKNVSLDLMYKFQGVPSDFSKNGVSVEYNSSNFFGGLRYKF